jgi:hypothetical protein
MNIKEYIPFEQALEMKELGFKEDAFGYLTIESTSVQLPLYQQAFRFFREKYNLHSHIEYSKGFYEYWILLDVIGYDTYEEAELACIKKLIEIAKNR